MKSPDDLLQGKNILIVDDDARNIFALSSYLEAIGIQVHIAENGFEAISYLRRNPKTEIILMDIMMPDMDGFEAIAKIKSDTSIQHIPIIAVTAKAMKGDREKCMEAGANEYVSKPVNLKELLEKMAKMTNQ